MTDIVVSCTSSDRDWAHWIARELEALGHVPHVHERKVKGDDGIYAWIQRRQREPEGQDSTPARRRLGLIRRVLVRRERLLQARPVERITDGREGPRGKFHVAAVQQEVVVEDPLVDIRHAQEAGTAICDLRL